VASPIVPYGESQGSALNLRLRSDKTERLS